MYNRYIPQADGSYRRNRIQEMAPRPEKPASPPPSPVPAPQKEHPASPCSNCMHNQPPRRPVQPRETSRKQAGSVGGFLKQLLPQDFEMEDLLVVLLLLLMAGDCQENQNSALLTLVLYLFL